MTKKILIVDNEKETRKTIKTIINKLGYNAETAKSGKQAIKKLKKHKFDLILLDILMPGMLGTEVFEWIRKNPKTRKQKVALLTILEPKKSTKKEINKLKPIEYFQKPIKLNDFENRLIKILDKKQKTVLLIEENEGIRLTIKTLLKKAKYKIIDFKNEDKFLKSEKGLKSHPDLILIDALIPRDKLLNTMQNINETKIALLVDEDTDLGKLAKYKNVVGFINEPFNIKSFLTKIKKILSKNK